MLAPRSVEDLERFGPEQDEPDLLDVGVGLRHRAQRGRRGLVERIPVDAVEIAGNARVAAPSSSATRSDST